MGAYFCTSSAWVRVYFHLVTTGLTWVLLSSQKHRPSDYMYKKTTLYVYLLTYYLTDNLCVISLYILVLISKTILPTQCLCPWLFFFPKLKVDKLKQNHVSVLFFYMMDRSVLHVFTPRWIEKGKGTSAHSLQKGRTAENNCYLSNI